MTNGGGWLAVTGIEGLLRGEVLLLRRGQNATIGRGSGSTFPLTRAAGYRAMSADPNTLRRACQGVSRQHMRITVPADAEVVVEDMSRAGTFLDGSRVSDPVHLRDLGDRTHEIRFGRGERIELRWVTATAAGKTE